MFWTNAIKFEVRGGKICGEQKLIYFYKVIRTF